MSFAVAVAVSLAVFGPGSVRGFSAGPGWGGPGTVTVIATVRVLRVRARDVGQVTRAAGAVVAYLESGQPGAAAGLTRYYAGERAVGRARGRGAVLVGLRGAVSGEALARLLRGRHAVTGRPLLAATGTAGRVERPDNAGADRASGGPDSAPVSAESAGGQGTVRGVGSDSGQLTGAGAGVRPASGAASRAGEWLTLAEAAVVAGVGASYLRRLVSRTAKILAAGAGEPGVENVDRGDAADGRTGADGLAADRGVEAGAPSAGQRAGRGEADLLVGQRGADGWWRIRRGEVERWCAARTPPATVLGYDMVCAVPKSVSLLWAFGDEALRADIAAALDAAVDATIGYLERHAAFGTVQGENRRALGLAVASYLHDVSRSDEAHLHVHNVLVNAVVVQGDPDDPGPGGWEWRAIDGEVLLAQVKTAGHVGAAVLRHELSARRGITWEPARNNVAEIAGFPADLLGAFSTRHGEVTEEFAQLVAAGLEPSGATVAAAQLRSRAPKKVLADAQVAAIQRDRLTSAGWTVAQVRELAPTLTGRPVPRAQVAEDDVAALFAQLAGASGLTAQATTFLRRDVIRQVAGWAGDRLGAEDIERLSDRFLADRRVVVLHDTTRTRRRHEPEPLYTTENLLTAEDTLFALYRQGQVAAGAPPRRLVDTELLDTQLETATRPAPVGAAGPALSAEQADLVRHLLTSGDLVRVAVGPAGTGKTEAMRTLTAIVTAAAHPMLATAHGGRQAEELAERIGIPARVVASWLTLLDHTDDPATVWPAGSVLIVDEATQVATRDAERLLRYATRTGTVVILLGDPAQLGSVGAGGWFAHMAAHTPNVPALTTVHRQAGAEMAPVRAALAALRADTAPASRAALDRLAEAGRVHLADSADALLERAVADWYTERLHHLGATRPRADAPRRADPDDANRAAKAGDAPNRSGAEDAGGADRAALDTTAPTARPGGADGATPTGGAADRAGSSGAHGAKLGARDRAASDATSRPAMVDGPAGREGDAAGRGGHGTGESVLTPRPAGVHMMAERNRDVDTLNTAARVLLAADGTLTGPVLHVASREFQAGDEVVTLTQAGHTLVPAGRPASAYIRTGTVGVVTAVHPADNPYEQTLEVHFPSKGTVRVPWNYLTHRFDDGREGGLGHAYALTAAKAQGSTMDTARAVVPDDTSRPGLYVMLSRARTDLHAYVLHRADLDQRDDDETWLPAGPDPDSPLDRLADRLARTRPDRLATDHDPAATEAHQLRLTHTLADLTAQRLAASNRADQPTPPGRRPAPGDTDATNDPNDAHSGGGAGTPRRAPATTRADAPHAPMPTTQYAPEAQPVHHATPTRRRAADDPNPTATPTPAPDAPHAPRSTPAAPNLAPADRATSAPTAPVAPTFAPDAPRRAPGSTDLPRQVLLRRAELAAETILRAAAVTHPPPQLLARIGPRPPSGPDSAAWDDAVTALAIYHARHQPDTAPHDPGPPPGATPDDRHRDPWLRHHDQATRLADAWAAALPDQARTRFHNPHEAIPRHRAIAGLHALLDHGHHPDQLHTALAGEPLTDIRTGAAVLARRVADLCTTADLDATLYELPAPATPQQEWNTVTRLLAAAEISHLATRPTATLLTERRTLDDQLNHPTDTASPHTPTRTHTAAAARRTRLDASLDRQTTQALLHATAEPADYLTALLGPRPTTDPATTAWDEAAHRIEHYRHHTLGLPYGTPATADTSDPARRALGTRPNDPATAHAYDQARALGSADGPPSLPL
ncbi:MobF family relaxase [Pseudofrankia sp. BMG5.37]|uniref:MobF family relaxase n=1 Tax=Pseudofrankia sp. BMG5.37 TaxID=3050035 RepID=UPI002895CEF5|nr:MobF family relaxase [Pseudofrankia sp. BMG5.37]MDT3446839.1 MobF family relaxase [Pseudofrankia sp. BMG5.37]